MIDKGATRDLPVQFRAPKLARYFTRGFCLTLLVAATLGAVQFFDDRNWFAMVCLAVLVPVMLAGTREGWLYDVTFNEHTIRFRGILAAHECTYKDIVRLRMGPRKTTVCFGDGSRAVVTVLMGRLVEVGDIVVPRLGSEVPIDVSFDPADWEN